MGTRRPIAGAYLFAPPSPPVGAPRAVLGARAGRKAGETAAAAARALERLRCRPGPSIETVLHECAAGGVYLARFDVCQACGWGPAFPYPAPDAAAEVLRTLLGPDDARGWFLAALAYLDWE